MTSSTYSSGTIVHPLIDEYPAEEPKVCDRHNCPLKKCHHSECTENRYYLKELTLVDDH